MENNQEVTAQGGRIGHRSGKSNRDPLLSVNIGAPKIFWNACQGAPSDAFSQGDASYDDHNTGLILTPNSANQSGTVYWNRPYDLTKDVYLKGTFLAGLGTGGNNCGIYFCGVYVYFNDTDNSIYLETSEFTSDGYVSGDILGDATWRTFEVIYEYKTSDVRYVTVLMNGKHICRVDIGGGYITDANIGVFANTATLTNIHYCKSFEVRSAIPWLTINVPNDGAVVALATLIHARPVSNVSIGDSTINWCADQGDPSIVAGATISDDAFYDTINNGVVLTENVDEQLGYLYWEKNYDYNKNVYIRATTYSGEGDGADNITIFMGSSSAGGGSNGSISVYIDDEDDDVKVYKNGSLIEDAILTNQELDDATFRVWEVIYEYASATEQYLHVYMNNVKVLRYNMYLFDGVWIPGGSYIGIYGVTGGDNNYHICRSFKVMSANPWLAING